jgi:hypothetical protein
MSCLAYEVKNGRLSANWVVRPIRLIPRHVSRVLLSSRFSTIVSDRLPVIVSQTNRLASKAIHI